MGKNTQRKCVFCGGIPVSREHILPQWLSKIPRLQVSSTPDRARPPRILERTYLHEPIEKGAPLTILHIPEPRGSAAKAADEVVKAPCKRCNNGWMALLESEIGPTLTALINGEAVSLTATGTTAVARWATKTSAMLEYNDAKSLTYTAAQLASIMSLQTPPTGTRVWIGRYAGGDRNMVPWHTFGHGELRWPDGLSDPVVMGRSIFVLGDLVLFTTNIVTAVDEDWADGFLPSMSNKWSLVYSGRPTRPFEWPPPKSPDVTDEEITRVMRENLIVGPLN